MREAFNTSSVAQAAALAAMDDHAHLERTLAMVGAERAWLANALEGLGLEVVPSVTNFLFVDLGPRAPEIHEGLHARGIVVRPLSAPGIATRARSSLGSGAGSERLVAALEEILA